jgi:hypothetical protein
MARCDATQQAACRDSDERDCEEAARVMTQQLTQWDRAPRQTHMTLHGRLRTSVTYLDVTEPAQLLTPGAKQPSVSAAGQELKHCAELLALLSLNSETPAWSSDAGKALEHRVAAAADGLAVLCAAQSAVACIASKTAILDSARAALTAAAAVAEQAEAHRAESSDSGRQLLIRAAAAAGQAIERCSTAASMHPCAATARALVNAGASVKNAASEAKQMLAPAAEEENCVDEDGDSCGFDEKATPHEAAVIVAAIPLLDTCLAVLQPVLRGLADKQKAGSEVSNTSLDALVHSYSRLAADVDAFTAALWPPQEEELLRRHCTAMVPEAHGFQLAMAGLMQDEQYMAALRATCDAMTAHGTACLAALDTSQT